MTLDDLAAPDLRLQIGTVPGRVDIITIIDGVCLDEAAKHAP